MIHFGKITQITTVDYDPQGKWVQLGYSGTAKGVGQYTGLCTLEKKTADSQSFNGNFNQFTFDGWPTDAVQIQRPGGKPTQRPELASDGEKLRQYCTRILTHCQKAHAELTQQVMAKLPAPLLSEYDP